MLHQMTWHYPSKRLGQLFLTYTSSLPESLLLISSQAGKCQLFYSMKQLPQYTAQLGCCSDTLQHVAELFCFNYIEPFRSEHESW